MQNQYNDHTTKYHRRDLRKNQTEAERVVWNMVRKQQIDGLKFFRQYSVGTYVLDFYCPKRRIAIEIDGGQHNEQEHKAYDVQRTEYLAQRNIQVIRFWNNEVLKNKEGVWTRIKENITPSNSPLS